jgi:site-specific DNA-methyltransferase (adenine-specific)
MAEYPDKFFDLAIVDPPYGIGLMAQRFTKPSRPNSYTSPIKHKVFNDNNRPPIEYFNELFRVSKNQIIWGATNLYDLLPLNDSWIFWNKMNGEGSHFADGEFAFTSFTCSSKMISISQHHGTHGGQDRIHPTQKPITLYKWLLKNYAKQGDKIIDTHLGSGSSAIAAYDFGCDFIGCEIDKDYYDAALKRFNTHKMQQTIVFNE